eukprot:296-Chlamydomonas_euryale.AAC.3
MLYYAISLYPYFLRTIRANGTLPAVSAYMCAYTLYSSVASCYPAYMCGCSCMDTGGSRLAVLSGGGSFHGMWWGEGAEQRVSRSLYDG